MDINVASETGNLLRVLVHRPGRELSRLTECNREELLFEAVPCVDTLGREHDELVRSIRRESGADVVYLTDLLRLAFASEKVREQAVRRATHLDGCAWLADPLLDRVADAGQLAETLVAGLTVDESRELGISRPIAHHDSRCREFALTPLPNLYFMRDPAFVINGEIVSSTMNRPARLREAELVRCALEATTTARFAGPVSGEDHPVEGGDVLVLGEHAIAVGTSERTTVEAVRALASRLFERGSIRRVYEVPLPEKRAYMHLDTVFTFAGPHVAIAHEPALHGSVRVHLPDGVFETGRSIVQIAQAESPGLRVVSTGDGDVSESYREQLTDGANLFAIAPGKVVAYAANRRSNRALRRAGVDVVEIEGGELVKGLGGPRCMTMPLERAVA